MSQALITVRDAIMRGLSFDEPLLVATGLRPIAEVDPTAKTRAQLLAESKRANNKVAGAMLRVNDRWNTITGPGASGERNDAPDEALARARQATVGEAGSTAVRLVRCWVDVPRDAAFLYVSDRRWLVTMTVAAAREWHAVAPEPEAGEGLVRDLGKAARQLGRSLSGDNELTKGLDNSAPNGAAALVVAWATPREQVSVSAGPDGVWLNFADSSGAWLRPGRPEWPLEQRVEALRLAGVPVQPIGS